MCDNALFACDTFVKGKIAFDLCFYRWESKAILRYIAKRHSLEAWHPSNAQQRALCDIAIAFDTNSFVPFVTAKLAAPAIGVGFPTAKALAEAEKKWSEDIWPSLQHLLQRTECHLLGGITPSIADLVILGNLVPLYGICPDSFAAKTAGLKSYFDALRACFAAQIQQVHERG